MHRMGKRLVDRLGRREKLGTGRTLVSAEKHVIAITGPDAGDRLSTPGVAVRRVPATPEPPSVCALYRSLVCVCVSVSLEQDTFSALCKLDAGA